jgi:hypothetical protein
MLSTDSFTFINDYLYDRELYNYIFLSKGSHAGYFLVILTLIISVIHGLVIGCPFFASNKKVQNEAKQSEKDAKANSKQARGSETKQIKVRLL